MKIGSGIYLYGKNKDSLQLRELNIGDSIKIEVKEGFKTLYGDYIEFLLVAKNHPGYAENTATLMTKNLIAQMPADGREIYDIENFYRRMRGNNRYKFSNIASWMCSNDGAGNWFYPTHELDCPPLNMYFYSSYNEYYTKCGFLAMLDESFVKKLQTNEFDYRLNEVDGGGYENFSAKIYLPGAAEVGLVAENAQSRQKRFEYFANAPITAHPTAACVENAGVKTDLSTLLCYRYYTRDAHQKYDCNFYTVGAQGEEESHSAYMTNVGIRPVCNLSLSEKVYLAPAEDGSYLLKP